MASADEHLASDGQVFNRLSPQYKIMEVNFISGAASDIPLKQSAARQAPAPAPTADASPADFGASNSITESFSQSASTRADKVARANQLLSDPSYPSGAVLNQLAGFLAKRL
jgi:hypothetical protein